MFRRQEQVDRADRRAARLKAEEAAKLLALRIGIQPVKLGGDRFAGDLRHAADRDLADFTFSMNIQKLDRTLPSHLSNSKSDVTRDAAIDADIFPGDEGAGATALVPVDAEWLDIN
jgi:hypothetical protein